MHEVEGRMPQKVDAPGTGRTWGPHSPGTGRRCHSRRQRAEAPHLWVARTEASQKVRLRWDLGRLLMSACPGLGCAIDLASATGLLGGCCSTAARL